MQIYPLRPDGRYTTPRTFGVYQDTRGQRYYGNHPVRQTELERVKGPTELLALYTRREEARALARR